MPGSPPRPFAARFWRAAARHRETTEALARIERNQEKIIMGIDDLKAAVARVQQDDADALAALKEQTAQISDLSAKLAAAATAAAPDDAALADLASQLTAATSGLHEAVHPAAPAA